MYVHGMTHNPLQASLIKLLRVKSLPSIMFHLSALLLLGKRWLTGLQELYLMYTAVDRATAVKVGIAFLYECIRSVHTHAPIRRLTHSSAYTSYAPVSVLGADSGSPAGSPAFSLGAL